MSGRISVPSRVVLVDKPAGCTSFDVVRLVKRGLSDKVGHAGTLDPFATGLLLVLVGQATRVSALLMDLPKEYAVRVQFGATSSTGDPDGLIEETGGIVGAAEVVGALDRFRGVITQRVPMTSAVKVGGERLYKKAHRGEEVETPMREVVIYDLTLVDFDAETQHADLIARVSKGTYVRRVAQDLGEVLGVGAYASLLRRTRVGTLSVDDATPPDAVEPSRLMALDPMDPSCLSVSAALRHLPSVAVAGAEAARAANGGEVGGGPAGRFLVRSHAGVLGVWEGSLDTARPVVVFSTPQE
jgi:tRNA pseudouridine55 synthase